MCINVHGKHFEQALKSLCEAIISIKFMYFCANIFIYLCRYCFCMAPETQLSDMIFTFYELISPTYLKICKVSKQRKVVYVAVYVCFYICEAFVTKC